MYYQPILFENRGIDLVESEYVIKHINDIYKLSDKSYEKYEVKVDKQSIGVEALKGFSSWIWNKTDSLKVLFIHQADKLTTESQNSILKLIEEPPNDTLIILISKNTDTLLQTIISRCLRIDVDFVNTLDSRKPEFLEGNYIDRLKIINEITKDENPREKALKLVEELINYYISIDSLRTKSDKLLEIYLGIKSGTNLKLSLNLINNLIN